MDSNFADYLARLAQIQGRMPCPTEGEKLMLDNLRELALFLQGMAPASHPCEEDLSLLCCGVRRRMPPWICEQPVPGRAACPLGCLKSARAAEEIFPGPWRSL